MTVASIATVESPSATFPRKSERARRAPCSRKRCRASTRCGGSRLSSSVWPPSWPIRRRARRRPSATATSSIASRRSAGIASRPRRRSFSVDWDSRRGTLIGPSASSRAAGACGPPSRGSSSCAPICCSSTSLPTTSIWSRLAGSRAFSRRMRGAWWWFPTTGTSSTAWSLPSPRWPRERSPCTWATTTTISWSGRRGTPCSRRGSGTRPSGWRRSSGSSTAFAIRRRRRGRSRAGSRCSRRWNGSRWAKRRGASTLPFPSRRGRAGSWRGSTISTRPTAPTRCTPGWISRWSAGSGWPSWG